MTIRELLYKHRDDLDRHIVRVIDQYGNTVVVFLPKYIDAVKNEVLDSDVESFYIKENQKFGVELWVYSNNIFSKFDPDCEV